MNIYVIFLKLVIIWIRKNPYWFQISIGEACSIVYPEINIKYCIWHMKRALNLKKNEICKEEVTSYDNCYILYKMLCNLFLCPIEYVVKVFNKIKNNSDNERFD